MRSICAVTAAIILSLAAGSFPVTAQEAPLLEPRLTFEVASVKVDTSQIRTLITTNNQLLTTN